MLSGKEHRGITFGDFSTNALWHSTSNSLVKKLLIFVAYI